MQSYRSRLMDIRQSARVQIVTNANTWISENVSFARRQLKLALSIIAEHFAFEYWRARDDQCVGKRTGRSKVLETIETRRK